MIGFFNFTLGNKCRWKCVCSLAYGGAWRMCYSISLLIWVLRPYHSTRTPLETASLLIAAHCSTAITQWETTTEDNLSWTQRKVEKFRRDLCLSDGFLHLWGVGLSGFWQYYVDKEMMSLRSVSCESSRRAWLEIKPRFNNLQRDVYLG